MGTGWEARRKQDWVWGSLHIQGLVEPTNQLHTAPQAFGGTPTHEGRRTPIITDVPQQDRFYTYQPFPHNHMLVHKYTNPCKDPDTYRAHKTGKSDSHKYTHRYTPDTTHSGPHGSTPGRGEGPDHADVARARDTEETLPQGRENWDTQEYCFPPYPHHHTGPHTSHPAQPTLDLRCCLQLQSHLQPDPGPFPIAVSLTAGETLTAPHPFLYAFKQYSLRVWGVCCEENSSPCP